MIESQFNLEVTEWGLGYAAYENGRNKTIIDRERMKQCRVESWSPPNGQKGGIWMEITSKIGEAKEMFGKKTTSTVHREETTKQGPRVWKHNSHHITNKLQSSFRNGIIG